MYMRSIYTLHVVYTYGQTMVGGDSSSHWRGRGGRSDPEASGAAHNSSVVVQGRSGTCQNRVAEIDGGGPAITRAPRSKVFIVLSRAWLMRGVSAVALHKDASISA
uniref:Uncharacterized protein n=1 Tax=Graphocephala atropunctata TaxID=36148 RepID=A0A1B6KXQ7_9HEMI